MPVAFGVVSVVFLVVSLVHHTSKVTSLVAIGALSLVIVRRTLTLREVRRGAENFRDARTD